MHGPYPAAPLVRAAFLTFFLTSAIVCLPPAPAAAAPGGTRSARARIAASYTRSAAARSTVPRLLGVTLSARSQASRLTVRCSAPVRMVWGRLSRPERVFLSFPGARLGAVPARIAGPMGPIRLVRTRQYSGRRGSRVWLEAELRQRCAVRVIAEGRRRQVILELLSEARPVVAKKSSGAPAPGAVRRAAQRQREGRSAGELPVRVLKVTLEPGGRGVDLLIQADGAARPTTGAIPGAQPRFYVDLRPARLAVAELPRVPAEGLLRGVRAGQLSDSPAVCRVVLDLLPAAAACILPTRDPATVRVAVRLEKDLPAEGGAPDRNPGSGTQREPPPGLAPGRGRTIAIDPGHGGLDSGAINEKLSLQEKEVTLEMAQRVRAILERAGYRVVMSRTGDERLRPPQRIQWLQGLRAELMVSIHCDSIDDREELEGTTTYFRDGNDRSRGLAEAVHAALLGATGATDRGVRPDTSRYESGFYLLRYARQPAVLVETGYITHPETARKFSDPAYLQQVARGIVAGLRAYLQESATRTAKR